MERELLLGEGEHLYLGRTFFKTSFWRGTFFLEGTRFWDTFWGGELFFGIRFLAPFGHDFVAVGTTGSWASA